MPQIVAFGGGGFSMEAGNRLLDDYVLALTGVQRPRVCFMPTASYAATDGAALHFEGTELAGVVSSREGARAFRVEASSAGDVAETELAVRHLRAPVLAPLAA